jgi:hypothetical protein
MRLYEKKQGDLVTMANGKTYKIDRFCGEYCTVQGVEKYLYHIEASNIEKPTDCFNGYFTPEGVCVYMNEGEEVNIREDREAKVSEQKPEDDHTNRKFPLTDLLRGV